MILFSIAVYSYDVSAGVGYGYLTEQENTTYDAATAVVYSAVTPSGFGHDIAIPTTGFAWGGVSNSLANYGAVQHLGSGGLGDIVAYDETLYGDQVASFITEGTTVVTSWTAIAVTPAGFGHDIAIGGPTWGAYQEVEFLAYSSLIFNSTFQVSGEVLVSFAVPPPLGFVVVGNVATSFTSVAGTVQIESAFECAGAVEVEFNTPVQSGFLVSGEVLLRFLTQSGQPVGCVTPDDSVPDLTGGGKFHYCF